MFKQTWYLNYMYFEVLVIKPSPCLLSTSFIQLSDALDFLQSHKHENEQGNTTVYSE